MDMTSNSSDILVARGLTSAHGATTVFAGIDLVIRAGESVAVVGPSGSAIPHVVFDASTCGSQILSRRPTRGTSCLREARYCSRVSLRCCASSPSSERGPQGAWRVRLVR